MEIRRISSHTLSIYLDASDLDELDITYEALDILCPHTHLVLRQLLETALAQTGFDPAGGRLLIEAFPVEEGCLLLFTLAQTEQEERASSAGPTLFLFSSFDLLRQACRQLDPKGSSALYWQKGQYILALHQGQICPFGIPAADSELLLAELKEHDCCLLKEQAVLLLNQYFS